MDNSWNEQCANQTRLKEKAGEWEVHTGPYMLESHAHVEGYAHTQDCMNAQDPRYLH